MRKKLCKNFGKEKLKELIILRKDFKLELILLMLKNKKKSSKSKINRLKKVKRKMYILGYFKIRKKISNKMNLI